MKRPVSAALCLAAIVAGAEVIDRIAVVVGKIAIKASDIRREMRITQFLNREPVSETAEARKKAAERLIDQAIIREQTVIVTLKDRVIDYSFIPQMLLEAGFRLKLFREEEVNLETAFMELTKGKQQ